MEIDFSKNIDTAVAESPRCEVPARINAGPQVINDYLPSFRDVIIPKLNVVQNLGDLKNTFNPGEIIYAQSVVLYSPPRVNAKTNAIEAPGTKPIIVTFLGRVNERFIEKANNGMIVNTEAEVRQAGGTLDYQEWKLKERDGMKRFEALVDMLVGIERPEICADDGSTFVFEADGKKYTFALWSMKGTLYVECLRRVVFKDRNLGCLRGGFPTHSYAISTREKVWDFGNRAWTLNTIPHQKSTPEFLELVSSFVGGEAASGQ